MKKVIFIMCLVSCMLLAGCREESQERGTRVVLDIETSVGKTIMPNSVLMEVRRYSVSGTGPNGASFGPVLSTESKICISDIAQGTWVLSASALNAEDNELAHGEASFEIKKGENNVKLVLDQVTGYGTLQLNFSWNADICSSDTLNLVVVTEDSSGNSVSRTRSVNTADCSASMIVSLAAGSYVLSVQTNAGGKNLGVGATDAVRIVSNTRATGNIVLKGNSSSDQNSTNITLDNRVGSPMQFYIEYTPKILKEGTVVTLKGVYDSLPSSIDPAELTYQWYRDGVTLFSATRQSMTIGAASGIHRYDLIVRSPEIGTMCGATLVLNVPST